MNKKIIGLTLISLSFVFGFNTFAETKITLINNQKKNILLEEEVSAGILPNSFWYWADIFGEELRFVGTIGKKNRADFLLDKARERLAEIKTLTMLGITSYTDELLKDQEKKVEHATKLYADLGEKLDQKIDTDNIKKNSLSTSKQNFWDRFFVKIKKVGDTLRDNLSALFSSTKDNVNDKIEKIQEFEESELERGE